MLQDSLANTRVYWASLPGKVSPPVLVVQHIQFLRVTDSSFADLDFGYIARDQGGSASKKYTVRLEAKERQRLEQLVRVGKTAAYRVRHANILLAVDESDDGPKGNDADVAGTLSVGVRTVESLRERFVLQGLDAAAGSARNAETSQR